MRPAFTAQSVHGVEDRASGLIQAEAVRERIEEVSGRLRANHEIPGEAVGIPPWQQRRQRPQVTGEMGYEDVVGIGQGPVKIKADAPDSRAIEALAHWMAAGKGIASRRASAAVWSGARIQSV